MKNYFTVDELIKSKTAEARGIKNIPNTKEKENIEKILIPNMNKIREFIGVACIVNSGFRSEELNKIVGGVPTSYHRKGLACDIVPKNRKVRECWEDIKKSNLANSIDQCILYEKRGFIHFGFVEKGDKPRAMFFEK